MAEQDKAKGSTGLPNPDDFLGTQKGPAEVKRVYNYSELFRYTTKWEKFCMFLGAVFAAMASAMIPYIIVIYGEFAALLVDRSFQVGTSTSVIILELFGGGTVLTDATNEENMEALRDDALAYLLASIAGAAIQLVLLSIAVDILNRIALRQISRIRKLFLESVLRQDMSWYDTVTGTNFAGKMTEDLDKIKEGMGEKIVIVIYLISTFIIAIIVAFIYGWKLTLVTLACCPLIFVSTAMVAKIQANCTEKELNAYSGAGSVAEEVFASIRTVVAFSGEPKEVDRYASRLEPSEKTGIKKGLYSGIGAGMMWLIMYCSIALALWYGVQLILDENQPNYTPAVLIIILFGVLMGAQNLGFSTPHIETFSGAKAAAQDVFSIIDRNSAIDPLDDRGIALQGISGDISLEQLHFHYPSRPDVKVLQGLTLNIKAGQTVAFVGSSGCGKSTVIQLMQRFYDPLSGVVRIDGRDIRDYNVGWIRSQIGVVGQEPILFATTIEENIRFGNPSATQSDIERAAQMANCHDFIMKFPKQYQTMVGERGAQMSGGQKQRIAIARALVRNPKILLLDEATSALDPTAERKVQKALDLASKGRTTLVVSHRLATVTNADLIVFVRDGVIVEQGTHSELMEKQGAYRQLVNINKRKEEEERKLEKLSPNNLRRRKVVQAEIDESSDEEEELPEATAKPAASAEAAAAAPKPDEEEEKYNMSFGDLMRLNKPEYGYIVIASIAAAMQGASYPLWAIFFGDFFGSLADEDTERVQSRAATFAYIFIGIGLFAGIATFLQTHLFNYSGVKMTTRLRNRAFKTIITQEMGYFDDEKNSVGALCARLSSDCSKVQGATGARIGIIIQTIATLSIGIIIAFIFSWNLALVTMVTIPFLAFCIYFEAKYMESSIAVEQAAIQDASQVAVEAVSNIRTVSGLCLERNVLERYGKRIDGASEACRKKLRFRGVIYSLGQAAPFIAYGISLWYGGLLVADGEVEFQDIIKVSEALIFGSMMLGQTLAYAPNMGEAILGAGRLMKLFERHPKIYSPKDKPFNAAEKTEGDIKYKDLDFHYPTRPDITVLKNLNLDVTRGHTVALVGPSGCGKSTCIQLLLRYYDPIKGSVNLDGEPTTEFNIDTLRSKMGLVSQEPVLFDRTIAQNICYGNNARTDIPMAEVIEAAKKANIHDFISNLPQGYDTPLGSKGAQLSGGQKQRIAIARALIRNPKILLLDEATSALDMESEKVVQNALDAARSGRTCITIAHRLTTIRDADVIFVLQNGAVAEKGTHSELMAKEGVYAELYTMQQVS